MDPIFQSCRLEWIHPSEQCYLGLLNTTLDPEYLLNLPLDEIFILWPTGFSLFKKKFFFWEVVEKGVYS